MQGVFRSAETKVEERVLAIAEQRRTRDLGEAMSLKNLFSVREHSSFGDAALLMIRLVGGAAFMMLGWG